MKNLHNLDDNVGLVQDIENQEKKLLLNIPRKSQAEKHIDELRLDVTDDAEVIKRNEKCI